MKKSRFWQNLYFRRSRNSPRNRQHLASSVVIMLFQDRVNSLHVLAGIGRRGENPEPGWQHLSQSIPSTHEPPSSAKKRMSSSPASIWSRRLKMISQQRKRFGIL